MNLGPRIRQLTKPAQFDKKRFELEWILPLEPGLSTHVTLFDLECYPPHVLAAGEGGDEAEALLELWKALGDHHDSVDALAHVAHAYHRRTGQQPDAEHQERVFVTRSASYHRTKEASRFIVSVSDTD